MVSALELLAHLMAAIKFEPNTENQVNSELDSMVALWTILFHRAKSWQVLVVLRAWSLWALMQNVAFNSNHWSGDKNTVADALSRPKKHANVMHLLRQVGKEIPITKDDIRAALSIMKRADVHKEEQALRLLANEFV